MDRRGGFTLIEVVIAVALGLVICSAAFAAVRLAARSTTACERLSIENRLFAAGLSAAFAEVDEWTAYDDPLDASRQPLRAPGPAGGSSPFRPLAFDPDFAQSDPRAWWRGMPTSNPTKRFGDYALFSRCAYASSPPDAAEDAKRSWLPETMRSLNQTLGHYGMIDYLPANSEYQYFAEDGRVPGEFCGNPSSLVDPVTAPELYLAIGGSGDVVRDIESLTLEAAFTLTTDPGYRALGVDRAGFANYQLNGVVAPAWRSEHLHADCPQRWDLAPIRPATWPDVGVDVRRFVYYSRPITLVTVRMTDPVSGTTSKLQFSAPGTSLRGARQQRGLDTHLPRSGS